MLTQVPVRDAGLRAQLVDAAATILRSRGLTELTTREISREAGCSEGALYTHFPTKADLVYAVCQERLPDLRAFLGDLIGRVGLGSVRDNIEEIISAVQLFYTELIPISSSVAADAELREKHRARATADGAGPRRTLEAVAAYIAAEQRIGRVSPNADPRVFASMLLGACFGDASVQHVFGGSMVGMDHETYAAALATALWEGLSPPPMGGTSTP